jgi:hypothetical protein
MTRDGSPNSLKHRALEVFALYGPLNPPAWAVLTPLYPIRSAYTYLLRLHRFGLLNRNRDANDLLVYSLSGRGRERLLWLHTQVCNSQRPGSLAK